MTIEDSINGEARSIGEAGRALAISAVCGAVGGLLPGGTVLANGMAGAIEGTVERTLNGDDTTWKQLGFDFGVSALTAGALDGAGRVIAKRAAKKAAGEVTEEVVEEVTEEVVDGNQIYKVRNKKTLRSNAQYTDSNGYKYTTDSNGNISNVQGKLVLVTGTRNNHSQRTVGGADRLSTDDGGHLIGTRFNGSGDIDNLVPQDSKINRSGGEWYKMESEWAKALDNGDEVVVNISPIYAAGGKRPTNIKVEYKIGNESYSRTIPN